MNKARISKLEKVWSLLEEILQEEQESFANLPENLQCSNKGESMESNIDTLEEVNDLLNELIT